MKAANNGVIRDSDLKQTPARVLYTFLVAIGIIIAVVGIAPVVWVMLSGFKDIREFVREPTILPKSFRIESYIKTWNDLQFLRYYRNSLFSVAGSVVCAVFFNGLLGYVLSKVKPLGHNVVFMLVMWGMLIPATTSIVPLFMNISRLHLTGSFIPLWLSIGASAFYVILFKNFFDDLPQALVEAAKIDGAGDFLIFYKLVIPLSKAIIMVVVMYAVNAAWSDFLLPYLTLKSTALETVMVRLFQFRGSRANDVDILRGIVFAVIPPIVLFVAFQKQITQVTIQSGIKG